MTNEIETAQKKLDVLLMSISPVSWDKVYYYAIRSSMGWDMYFCVKEAETGLIISSNIFFERYDKYDIKKNDLYAKLYQLTASVYEECKNENKKLWKTMTFVADRSGQYDVEFTYESPAGKNIFKQREDWEEKYFGEHLPSLKGKYPSAY